MLQLIFFVSTLSCMVFDSGEAKNPPHRRCPKHEVYSWKPICPPDTCCARAEDYNCCNATSPPYKTGCTCKKGYYYRIHLNGPCVPECECPKHPPKCAKNEVYSCKPICPPDTCRAIGKKYDCCTATSPPYKTGCKCKDGYYRKHEIGPCVPQCECPKTPPKCPKNEEYSSKPICPPDTCCAKGKVYDCCDATSLPYKTGCKCKKGYYRLCENGPCVPACECPKPGPIHLHLLLLSIQQVIFSN